MDLFSDSQKISKKAYRLTWLLTLLLASCGNQSSQNNSNLSGVEIKFLVGSDLAQFCQQAAARLNQTKPKTKGGQSFYLTGLKQKSCPNKP